MIFFLISQNQSGYGTLGADRVKGLVQGLSSVWPCIFWSVTQVTLHTLTWLQLLLQRRSIRHWVILPSVIGGLGIDASFQRCFFFPSSIIFFSQWTLCMSCSECVCVHPCQVKHFVECCNWPPACSYLHCIDIHLLVWLSCPIIYIL